MAPPQTKAWRNAFSTFEQTKARMTAGVGTFAPYSCPGRDYDSEAPLPTCGEDCSICCSQYLPEAFRQFPFYREAFMHSDATAAAEIKQLTDFIDRDHNFVRLQLNGHGDTIMKRWHNRTVGKRETLLLKAFPDMCKHKLSSAEMKYKMIHDFDKSNPAEHYTRTPSQQRWMQTTRRRFELELLPYLNVIDLSQDKNMLLALLHHRSHSEPADWVMFDFYQVRRLFDEGMLTELGLNPHCVALKHGDYGRLVHWNKTGAHSFDIMGYPRAHMVLQAQSKLFGFLRRAIELILDNQTSGTQQGHEKLDMLAAGGFSLGTGSLRLLSSAAAPYSSPPRLNLTQLLDVIRSQHRATIDELFVLQTDPEYVRLRLRQLDASDQDYQFFIEKCVDETNWRMLVVEAERVAAVQHEHGDGHVVNEAIRTLDFLIRVLAFGYLNRFKEAAKRSKAFGHHFKRRQGQAPMNTRARANLFESDLLLWNIIELCEPGEGALDASWHIACIDDTLSQATLKEKARMDFCVYEALSQIAALAKLSTAIMLNKPHHGSSLTFPEFHNRVKDLKHFGEVVMSARVADALRLTIPKGREIMDEFAEIEKFMALPLPGRNIEAQTWVRAQDLYSSHIKIWSLIREGLLIGLQDVGLFTERQANAYIKPFTVYRQQASKGLASAHIANLRKLGTIKKAEKVERLIAQRQAAETERAAISQVYWRQGESEDDPAVERKVKVKTRPSDKTEANVDDAAQALGDLHVGEGEAVHTVAVSKASLALFGMMYDTYGAMEGSVQWSQVVAALVDAGCSATPCGGSAFSFKDEVYGKGTVVLHRPHPDSTVDPIMLRSMGKKLARWFGWGEGTFVKRVT